MARRATAISWIGTKTKNRRETPRVPRIAGADVQSVSGKSGVLRKAPSRLTDEDIRGLLATLDREIARRGKAPRKLTLLSGGVTPEERRRDREQIAAIRATAARVARGEISPAAGRVAAVGAVS